MIKCAFTSGELFQLLGGYWYGGDNIDCEPPFFAVDYFVTGPGLVEFPNTCFVAMTKETWQKGTENSGHFTNIFSDSHITLVENYYKTKVKKNVVCVIAEHPIAELCGVLPQLVVENPYSAIRVLAAAAREKMADNGTIIAVTGAVGKSTTVNMLHCLLADESDYISNINGHNSRTGVPMWLASVGRFSPQFGNPKPNVCTLEVAASALWMRGGGICKVVQPHIGIITHIALTQYQPGSRNIHDVAITKSRICQGITAGGKAVLFRDMPEYDFIKETVIEYGAAPISYGETPDCDTYVKQYTFAPPTAGEEIVDLHTDIEAVVLGEEISYKIGAIGKPIVLNSLAALTAAKLAGFDIAAIVEKLSDFKGNANVLQISNCHGVCIVNNSHNIEVPSIVSAFDLFKQIKQKPGSRKIVLMSRVDNWRDKAQELHLQLTDPIKDSGCHRFFFHEPLNEFSLLVKAIPAEVIGGRYSILEDVVYAVINDIREGDSVLAIGSHFTSNFGNVMKLLTKGIADKMSGRCTPSQQRRVSQINTSVSTVYSLERKKRLAESGDLSSAANEGMGHIIILYLALSLLFQEKMLLTDKVPMGEPAWRERNSRNALGVIPDDCLSVKTLLDAYVAANAPDAVIALAHFVFKKAKLRSSSYFREICGSLSIDAKAAINLTGRKNRRYDQNFSIADLEKLASFFFSLPLDALKPLKSTAAIHKEKMLLSDSILHSVPEVIAHYCFGEGGFHAIVHARIKGESVVICVLNTKSGYARDSAVCDMLQQLQRPHDDNKRDKWIALDDSRGFNCITIAGDTYFGEWYTRQREKIGQPDALQQYGYSYSFEKVACFLPKTDYNIVNFEAVLTEQRQSLYSDYFTYTLDASPEDTLNELKRRNVHGVMLANNHCMDFGESAAKQSQLLFVKNGFHTVGFGQSAEDAEHPLCFAGAGRRVLLFNAYWYRSRRHSVSRHYALGGTAGTACLEERLFRKIAYYRQKHPDAFIVLSPHWGTDFSEPAPLQRQLAKDALDAGADCIIGHGSHIASGHEWIDGKFVIYSIGNFVFNSNGGDFAKKGKTPVAYVAKLFIHRSAIRLRLYPILVHNPTTFWQPCPATKEQFDELLANCRIEAAAEIIREDNMLYLEFVL